LKLRPRAIFKQIQFKVNLVKLFLHIFKICQISRACILNLDRWSYIKKHRMEKLRHIKLISTSSFITVLITSHSSTYTVFAPMFTSPYSQSLDYKKNHPKTRNSWSSFKRIAVNLWIVWMKAKNRQLKQLLANFLHCFECKCNGALFLSAIFWSATTNFPPVEWKYNLNRPAPLSSTEASVVLLAMHDTFHYTLHSVS
jgi:hypothetical protein